MDKKALWLEQEQQVQDMDGVKLPSEAIALC